MNKEKYLEMRAAMLDEAQNLINEGKIEDAAAKREEIEKLDADFEQWGAHEQMELQQRIGGESARLTGHHTCL